MNFSFLTDENYDFLGAFWMTIQLTLWAALGSLIFGTVLAAMRVSPVPLMRAFGTGYVNIVRNIPLAVVIFMMWQVLFSQLGIELAGRPTTAGPEGMGVALEAWKNTNNFRLAVLGLVLYTSTFVCESLRSGINTVNPGQAEAARAIGMKFTQVLTIIVLPQAFRAVIAPLGSVLIALIKNTTVAAAIGVAEATILMRNLIEFESDKLTEIFISISIGFVILTLPVGLLFSSMSRRLAVRR